MASGLESKELARYVVIKPATLQRRATAGRFKQDEGDRLYRFAEVYRALLISLKEINSGRGAGSSIRCAVSVVGDRWKWWRRLLALKLCWI
ncbi:hypothetical protein HSBAA_PA_3590 (plasmid) [Vreelandella sulfidaeris]|uniref:Antitoxin Xre-like helix-turn-helix domain-containing protein n=1 Tax=Vreelandella sulfidaeris TaxID=115553 RepID=A0A455UHM5_9GAMM|nr:hypothetical protein HSBAA_PA_3590 [Halomonas sulfidaeris]